MSFKRFSLRSFSFRHLAVDALLITASLYFSLWLRLGDARLDEHLEALNHLALGFVVLRLVTMLSFGAYQILWRYISTSDATRLAIAVAASIPILVSWTYLFSGNGMLPLPRSFFVIDGFVCAAVLMGVRLLRRRLFERTMQAQTSSVSLGRLIIYGAGQNGRLLAQRMVSDPGRDRDLLGFIDDDPQKMGKRIHGLPVLGGREDMESILSKSGCTDLIVAVTSPPAELMRDLVVLGRKIGVRVQRIAHFDETQILSRSEALSRQVELKDLLNRPSSQVDLPSLQSLMAGKVVLVTGAGGSIGAELSRQIARFSPAKLLLLDHSEFNLFEIDRELRPSTQDFAHFIPLLTDVKDANALRFVFEKYKPQVVFHAAAYKHVHLVEANPASAVLNNVKGTWNLLKLCEDFAVERFVMISTDKAVNPVGAMGASKRLCEILTSLAGFRLQKPYSSVRFGNVLGSSGSLIPLLRKQIEDGGPVTLTHPDMTRYFMLIPEAVSLVLMSATLSQPGDINVLKMGEPIRILDLAKSLMALMGKGESEIDIAFTGVRPGEKMFEELYLTGDELTTRHADILTVPRSAAEVGRQTDSAILLRVEQLIQMAERQDSSLLQTLRALANDPLTSDKIINV